MNDSIGWIKYKSMSSENSSSPSGAHRKSSGMPLPHLWHQGYARISGPLKLPVSFPVQIQALHNCLPCWRVELWLRGGIPVKEKGQGSMRETLKVAQCLESLLRMPVFKALFMGIPLAKTAFSSLVVLILLPSQAAAFSPPGSCV